MALSEYPVLQSTALSTGRNSFDRYLRLLMSQHGDLFEYEILQIESESGEIKVRPESKPVRLLHVTSFNLEQFEKNLTAAAPSPPFIEIGDHIRFIESAIATLTEADLPAVREAQRKSMHAVSDEALDEYFTFMAIIQGVMNRLDLYREYRPR